MKETGLRTLLPFVLDVGRLQQQPKGEEPLKSLHAQPFSTAHGPASSLVQQYGPVVVRMRANYQLRCRCSALAQSRYLCCPTPWFPAMAVAARAAFPCRCFPLFYGTCADAPHWEMAAELEPLMAEWLGPEEAEDAGGSGGPQGRRERGFGPLK